MSRAIAGQIELAHTPEWSIALSSAGSPFMGSGPPFIANAGEAIWEQRLGLKQVRWCRPVSARQRADPGSATQVMLLQWLIARQSDGEAAASTARVLCVAAGYWKLTGVSVCRREATPEATLCCATIQTACRRYWSGRYWPRRTGASCNMSPMPASVTAHQSQ